jgi:photosystem II stability/assembly factor-like uncharacterized protein
MTRRILPALFLLFASFSFAQPSQRLLEGMQYRLIGPFRGGRAITVAGIPGEPNVYYFGAVSGGIWKSTDAGASWHPLFDHEPISSIGSIAIAPSDPNIIYAGTGEACLRGNISYGDGVYKSMDGGKTWKNVGLKDSRQIGRVIIDPKNPDIVFVAAVGHAFGPNAERGIFRTMDGGKTWSKVLYVDDKTGGIDVEFDPHNPNILFAAMYQVLRQPWTFTSGGPGSGLYRSSDGGTTWTRLHGDGLPEGILGRISVSISDADSNRIYTLIEADKGGLYRSDDGGQHWQLVNSDERYRQRAWYFSHVFADPKNPDAVYVLNTGMFRSTDAGKTFTLLPAPHGDHHALWIDPTNPKRMINGDDGGVTISIDGGQTWSSQMNQPTAQFYHVSTDNRFPYYVYGAQQDNTPVAIASWSDSGVITTRDWYEIGGSESAYIAADPRDANITYAAGQGLTRFDKRTEQSQDINPMPVNTSGHGASDFPHRFQWTEPIFVSPHDPSVIYTAGEVVFQSTDEGRNWTIVSPDLTRNDKSKQISSGGPITKDNTSVEYYDTIFTLAESPITKGLLWAGSDDGLIHITRDGGAHWQDVTPKQLPEWSMISLIDPSPHEAGAAYAAVDRHKLDDIRPYIYKTDDYGKTWTEIVNGIPDGAYVHVVREDPKRRGLLYAGTETGIYVSFDDGGHWEPLQLNLPCTPVHDLVIKNNDLVVATHGRSFWILDDLSPLEQWNAQTTASEAVLFRPRPAYRVRFPDQVDKHGPVGQNPPAGAILYYYLKSAPKNDIKLEILDSEGNAVRTYTSAPKAEAGPAEWPDVQKPADVLPKEAGVNRFAWDLHYQPPLTVPGTFYETDLPPKGAMALPGTYQVRLTVDGKSQTAPLQVLLDPRVHVTRDQLQRQFDLEQKISERLTAMHRAINELRDVRSQVEAMDRKYESSPAWQSVHASAQALIAKLTSLEEKLIQTKMKSTEGDLNFPTMLDEQLISLSWGVDSGDEAPTEAQVAMFNTLSNRIQAQLGVWDGLLSKDVPDLNRAVEKQKIPMIEVRPAPQGG